jgi:Holliday junction resolvase RusA-like endonuclease
MYDPATAECWKGQIAAAVGKAPKPLDGPVFVHAELFFRRPQGLNRKKDPDGAIRHVKKPDADNCGKALLDCLTGLGWWHDDSQVCHLVVSKYYTEKNGAPGSRIVIKQLGVEL